MSRRLLAPLLGLVCAAAGCQAPTPRGALRVGVAVPGSATLTAHLAGPAGYALRYLATSDWQEATATLSLAAAPVATQTVQAARLDADGSRSATFSFAGLAPGAGYALDVRLRRRDAAGTLVAVGVSENLAVTLVAGANTIALPAPTFTSEAGANPGEPTDFVTAYVASWPAAGPGARFGHPADAVQDQDGNTYVSDSDHHRVLAIDGNGEVTVLAGAPDGSAGEAVGDGTAARFDAPAGLCLASDGDLYVADRLNHRICRIDLAAPHAVTVVAGDGTAGWVDSGGTSLPRFNGPAGLAEGDPGVLYVADADNNAIRRVGIGPGSGTVETFAGDGGGEWLDGAASTARFLRPWGLVADGDVLYVADRGNQRIRAVHLDASTREATQVSTVAGSGAAAFADAAGALAAFNDPTDVALAGGVLYVADGGNRRVRRIEAPLGAAAVTTQAGSGERGQDDAPLLAARFLAPFGLAVSAASGQLLVTDREGARVRRLGPASVLPLAGDGAHGDLLGAGDGLARPLPTRVAFEPSGDAIVTDVTANRLWRLSASGGVTAFSGDGVYGDGGGAAGSTRYREPAGIVRRPDGKFYVADTGNHQIRLTDADGSSQRFAGSLVAGDADGNPDAARFREPFGLALGADGLLYVSELCGRIRAIDTAPGGQVATLAGSATPGFADGGGGPAGPARFDTPRGLAVGAAGRLVVADTENHRIRLLVNGDNGWQVSTLLGDGTASFGEAAPYRLARPADVAVDADGTLWIADQDNRRVRRVTFAGDGVGAVRSVGGGAAGYLDGPGDRARFAGPFGLLVGADGTLFVADRDNGWLRTIKD